MAKERLGLRQLTKKLEDVWTGTPLGDTAPPPLPSPLPLIPPSEVHVHTESDRERITDYRIPERFPTEPVQLSLNNLAKLDAAIEHIRKLFADASSPQIGGRKFFGDITLRTRWQQGECLDLFPSFEAHDRVQRPIV